MQGVRVAFTEYLEVLFKLLPSPTAPRSFYRLHITVAQEHVTQPTTGTQAQYHQTPEAAILASGVHSCHIGKVRLASNLLKVRPRPSKRIFTGVVPR